MFLQTVIPCVVKTALAFTLDYVFPATQFEYSLIKFITFSEASYQPFMYMLINK